MLFTTTCLLVVFACLSLTSRCAAEDARDELTARLRYSDQTPQRYIPNHFDLATEAPEDNWILPDDRGRDRLTIRKADLGRIEGAVVDHEGQFVKDATAGILGHALNATCDAHGKFVLQAPVGRYGGLTSRRTSRSRLNSNTDNALNVQRKGSLL